MTPNLLLMYAHNVLSKVIIIITNYLEALHFEHLLVAVT